MNSFDSRLAATLDITVDHTMRAYSIHWLDALKAEQQQLIEFKLTILWFIEN